MLGRDILSRVIYGARSVLSLTGLGAWLAVILGTIIGLASGYWGGLLDELIMRVLDSLLAIPALLLALVLLGAVGRSQSSVLAVITVVYVPIVARVVRSEVLSVKALGYIEAAQLRGEALPYILFREILPSVLPALSVEAALRFSYGIFLVASLGYLGVGVRPPTPDWGLMVKEARDSVRLVPWALYFPAGAISLLVIGVNLAADGLKSALQSSARTLSPLEQSRIRRARRLLNGGHRADSGAMRSGRPGLAQEVAVLQAQHVTASYRVEGKWVDALRDISLEIRPGETLGVVGESGSGKSTLALAIVQYLSSNGAVRSGTLDFEGTHLLGQSRRDLRAFRRNRVALIPQDPMASLNPSMRVGAQIEEVLRQQGSKGKAHRIARVIELVDLVRIPDPKRVIRQFPHQLSGGMQQRIIIAMALAANPQLLILDEPTTGLDVTTEATILELVAGLLSDTGRSAIYISHDLGVVARVSNRVAVLYAGDLVETGPVQHVFSKPKHPYTLGLLASIPKLKAQASACELPSMEGTIPSPEELPAGCVFTPRCPLATDRCQQRPQLLPVGPKHDVRCHHTDQVETVRETLFAKSKPRTLGLNPTALHTRLRLEDVVTRFPIRRTVRQVIARSPQRAVQAVNGVSLMVEPGSTLGIVGESGSGKTTLARSILGLTPTAEGRILLGEIPLPTRLAKRSKTQRRQIQAVSQNPDQALNPHIPVGTTLARQMLRLSEMPRSEIPTAVNDLLMQVGLTVDDAFRLPSQLSGGEKQRVAIARAIAADSGLIVCDEATSSLDVSVQARILNLLAQLQAETGRITLFITHDLAVVAHLADQIAVMYLGQVMESGPRNDVLSPPYHPYTEALLSSYPAIDPSGHPEPIHLSGEVPSPVDVPTGCPFQSRCPRIVGAICRDLVPPRSHGGANHEVACHIPLGQLASLQMRPVAASDSQTKDGC